MGAAAPAAAVASRADHGVKRIDAPAPESVLYQDDFDDPSTGTCRSLAKSSNPDYKYECFERELLMSGIVPPARSFRFIPAGHYSNASVAFDARLVGGFEQREFGLYCREDAAQTRGYALVVRPALQLFIIGRGDDDGWTTLAGPATSNAIKAGSETNRFELSCVGDTVTGRANGVDLGSFHDTTHRSGRFKVTVRNSSRVPLPIDARLDNLVVTER